MTRFKFLLFAALLVDLAALACAGFADGKHSRDGVNEYVNAEKP
jgi:hypothetical protein